jgi:hypothetical protein
VTAINDEQVACVSSGEDGSKLVVLDSASGQEISIVPLDAALHQCFFTPERMLLAVGADWVACFDPWTGGRRWWIDGLRLPRAASLALEVDGFYLTDGSETTLRSYEDGHVLWRRDLFDSPPGRR